MPSFQLVARRGPKAGEKFPLKTQTIIIGRDSTADIHLNDPEVSRNHCRLILEESAYYLQDLGSTNGTFVDSTRLGGEPAPLSNGQIIQLGSNVTLLFQQLSDDSDVMATMFSVNDQEKDADAVTELYDYESDPALQLPEQPAQATPSAPPQTEPPRFTPEQRAEPQISYSPPPLPSNEQYTQKEAAAYDEAKKKQRRNYIIIGILVAVLVLCCACAAVVGAAAYLQNSGVLDIPTAYLPTTAELNLML
ncbi:MAG: FHA domain-containing protein [Sphaerospermopsis sp. SIO1G2]|nr:FHA domain-containing protein [Sphaerospermopsis sp. SIO1G2]